MTVDRLNHFSFYELYKYWLPPQTQSKTEVNEWISRLHVYHFLFSYYYSKMCAYVLDTT